MFGIFVYQIYTMILLFALSVVIYTADQYIYYVHRASDYLRWAVGGRKSPNLGSTGYWCQLLLFRNKQTADPPYLVHYTLHTLIVVALQYTAVLHIYPIVYLGIIHTIGRTFMLLLLMHFVQYFEHLMLHRWLYRYHKPHHYFKNPEPWDGYYVHPIETYINTLTIFVFPCLILHQYIGLIEVMVAHSIFLIESGISHTGICHGIPYLDKMATHHEIHHTDSDCNYGTLTDLSDRLFGTMKE